MYLLFLQLSSGLYCNGIYALGHEVKVEINHLVAMRNFNSVFIIHPSPEGVMMV